jgi:hypothetical protein
MKKRFRALRISGSEHILSNGSPGSCCGSQPNSDLGMESVGGVVPIKSALCLIRLSRPETCSMIVLPHAGQGRERVTAVT